MHSSPYTSRQKTNSPTQHHTTHIPPHTNPKAHHTHPGHTLRKIVHGISPIFLIYYILPDTIPALGMTKITLILTLLTIITIIEGIRLASGKTVYGLRTYEARRPGAYYYGTVTMVFSFILLPWWITAPSLTTMAWVDPLCGKTRRKKIHPLTSLIPAIMIFGLFYTLICPFMLGYPASPQSFIHIPTAASIAILAEQPQIKWLDDDMLMLAAPEITLLILSLLIGPPIII